MSEDILWLKEDSDVFLKAISRTHFGCKRVEYGSQFQFDETYKERIEAIMHL